MTVGDMHQGWAPSDRVRRSVLLPISLDHRLAKEAQAHNRTPSALVVEALESGVQTRSSSTGEEIYIRGEAPAEKCVQRVVVLDHSINDALDEEVSRGGVPEEGEGDELRQAFSAMVESMVRRYLDQAK